MSLRSVLVVALASVAVAVGCSSSSSSGPTPATAKDAGVDSAPFKSDCGHPGDPGNALGVGKFCSQLSDCSGNTKATLCTILGSQTDFFCTFSCHSDDPPGVCGDNAECQCQDGQCGCTPSACVDHPADAGTDTGSGADTGTAADAASD